MIKLLISSFENTLLDEEEAIPTSTMLEIDRIRNEKIKFVVSTSMQEKEILYYNKDYPFIDYSISLCGGVLRNLKTNEKKTYAFFTKEELEEIKEIYPKEKIRYYTEETVEDFLPQEKVYQVEVIGKKKQESKKWNTYFLKRGSSSILILSKNNSYQALRDIMQEEKCNIDEVLPIIGNEWDEEILRNISKTYVVKNAPKSLITKSHLTKSNKNKGVEIVIKKELK